MSTHYLEMWSLHWSVITWNPNSSSTILCSSWTASVEKACTWSSWQQCSRICSPLLMSQRYLLGTDSLIGCIRLKPCSWVSFVLLSRLQTYLIFIESQIHTDTVHCFIFHFIYMYCISGEIEWYKKDGSDFLWSRIRNHWLQTFVSEKLDLQIVFYIVHKNLKIIWTCISIFTFFSAMFAQCL